MTSTIPTTATDTEHWAEQLEPSGLHEPTVRAIIDTMKRTGAAFGARVLEAQYRLGQVEDTEHADAKRLRQLADWMEQHPKLAKHLTVPGYSKWDTLSFWVPETEHDEDFNSMQVDQVARMREIRRAIGGTFDKDSSGTRLELKGMLGDNHVTISADRSGICKAVVVGTETKTVKDYANCPEVEQEVDIVEWQCPESILG